VSPFPWVLTWVAAGAAALFAGGALYVSLVEHPARLATGPPMAVAQFRTSYPRAAWLQGGLAAAGALAGIGAWLGGAPIGWLAAGVLLGLVVPYTLVGILPTNKRLLDRTLSPDAPEAQRLLRRWTALHAVRTLLGLAAAAAMAHLLARG
jgi:Anthrone oxygenase